MYREWGSTASLAHEDNLQPHTALVPQTLERSGGGVTRGYLRGPGRLGHLGQIFGTSAVRSWSRELGGSIPLSRLRDPLGAMEGLAMGGSYDAVFIPPGVPKIKAKSINSSRGRDAPPLGRFSLIYDRRDLPHPLSLLSRPLTCLFPVFVPSIRHRLHNTSIPYRLPGLHRNLIPRSVLLYPITSASAFLPWLAHPRSASQPVSGPPSLPKQLSYRSSLQPHRHPVWARCSAHHARLRRQATSRKRGAICTAKACISRLHRPAVDQIAVYWVTTPFSRLCVCPVCPAAPEPDIGPVLGSSQRVRPLSRPSRMIGCCPRCPCCCSRRLSKHTASLGGLGGLLSTRFLSLGETLQRS